MKLTFSACLSAILLAGCSSSSSTPDSDNQDSVLNGIFIDSAVSGLTYNTETLNGITDSEGNFQYIAGETIIFSIGSISFPSVPATVQVTPMSLAADAANPVDMSTNIARFLQSIDLDGNAENGISISPDIVSTTQINFDVSVSEFENNPDVINLVANSGSTNTQLIPSDDANAHLNIALAIANTTAEIMSFSTGEELLAAGGSSLTGNQLETYFSGKKFISLDGSFDWEFFENGTFDSFDLAGTDTDYIGLEWSISNNTLCRARGTQMPCVTVFALGEAFRLSLDGRGGSDGLES